MSRRKAPPKRTPSKSRPSVFARLGAKMTRDLVMFTVGLVLVVNEAVIRTGDPREVLIILFAAMMGLPLVFQGDEFRRRRDDDYEDEP